MDIGDIGVWTTYRAFGRDRAGEAAQLVEELGYGALWVGGSPHVPDVRPILVAATEFDVASSGVKTSRSRRRRWRATPGCSAGPEP